MSSFLDKNGLSYFWNKILNLVSGVRSEILGKQNTLVSGTNIKTINNQSILGSGNISTPSVPAFTSADNGKILGVVNGQLAWVSPVTIYTGTGAPSSSQGNDGDIYLRTS